MTRYLIDTNVLVYLHDGHDPRRQERASQVVRHLGRARRAALSTQVLAEFSSVALRKLEPPLSASEVRAQVERFGGDSLCIR